MSDTGIGETIATNLVPDPRLANVIPGAVNVVQAVLAGGMGVSLEKGAGDGAGYVTPWSETADASGDRVCVLIVSANDLSPSDGESLETPSGTPPVWLRGSSTGYAEVMAIRTGEPAAVRLHAPESGVLTVLRSGVFTIESWEAMQERGIIYFDGGGIIQASESGYTLPPATIVQIGGVKPGDGLEVEPDGTLNVIPQSVPIATQDTAGVVRIGQGLRVTADGTVSVRLGENMGFDQSGNITSTASGWQPDLSDYYTRTESDGRYYTRELADRTFATATALNELERKVDGIDVGGGTDLSGYATEDWVENGFVRKTDYRAFRIVHGQWNARTTTGNAFFSTRQSITAGFTGTPVVMVECSNAQVNVCVQGTNASGFTIAGFAINGGNQNIIGSWTAIGPVDQ